MVPGSGVGYCVIIRSEDGIGDGTAVRFEEGKGASLGGGCRGAQFSALRVSRAS